jgi:hypothetical protein
MDYKKHYELLINSRKERIIIDGEYYEKHHIVPKSMGGGDDPNNLIYLTAREHFIAHWLLWRIYRNEKMAFAFYAMTYMGKNQTIKSSRIYEESKLARREFIIKNNKKYHKGKKLSQEHIERIRNVFKNMIRTEEHCRNISKSLKNKTKTKEHKENISKSLLGKYKWSEEKKINHSNKVIGDKNGRSKKVCKFTYDGKFLSEYTTMKEANLEFNLSNGKEVPKSTFYRYVLKSKIINGIYFEFIK